VVCAEPPECKRGSIVQNDSKGDGDSDVEINRLHIAHLQQLVAGVASPFQEHIHNRYKHGSHLAATPVSIHSASLRSSLLALRV
jgi:hypothetical protein